MAKKSFNLYLVLAVKFSCESFAILQKIFVFCETFFDQQTKDFLNSDLARKLFKVQRAPCAGYKTIS